MEDALNEERKSDLEDDQQTEVYQYHYDEDEMGDEDRDDAENDDEEGFEERENFDELGDENSTDQLQRGDMENPEEQNKSK